MKNKFNFKSIILTLTLLTLGVGQMWGEANNWKVKGEGTGLNGWNSTNTSMTQGSTYTNIWYIQVSGNCEFKVVGSTGAWGDYEKNGNDHLETNGSINTAGVTNNSGNFKCTRSGTWYICYNTTSGKVYGTTSNPDTPPTYTVTYNGNGKTSGSVPTDASSPYNSGSTVTVKGNTGSLAKTGYTFAGWNTAANGTGTYYAPGATFSITANTTLYAIWVSTDVLGGTKVMAYCGELNSWNQSNYQFKNNGGTQLANITISTLVTVVDDSYKTGVVTLAPNTTYYNQGHWDSGLDCKIQAGYLYVVRGSKTSTYFTQKDVNGTNYLYEVSQQNSSTAATRTVTTTLGSSSFVEGTSTLSVSTSGGPGKSVLGRTNSLLYFLYNGSSWSQVTLSAGNLNVSALTEGSYTLATVLFDGYIYVVADTDNFEVTSASTATLTYHANYIAGTGSGTGSVPAAQTVAVNANATVAGKNTLAFVNYTFQGWNTEEHITGTSYAVGSSITMDANKDLYAVWTRSIPLDDQGATTAVTGDVYGTYNSTYLPSFTNPEKTGYTFQGWYTQIGGGGNFVINTSRVFQASMNHWTNASCQFIRPSTSTSSLYAKWTQTVTLNANTANHGTGSDGSATATWNKGTLSNITHCTPAADFKLDGYYTNTTGGSKILNADGSFAATNITNYITSSKWTKAGATTLYAQYVPIPVKLLYGSSTPLNSPTDGGAMSYDATEHAYYKDVTTNSSPYYFRFDYNTNSEQYSGNWASYPDVVEAVANGSKVDCNQTVKNWENKGSIKFTGANGSSIRIWFDSQNKKAWITEPGYSVTINNGAHGTVSPNGAQSVGASGITITATPTEGYKLASWNVTGGAHVASSTSATTTLTATADGTVTAIYETEAPIRLYYSNPAGWSNVYAYLWDEDNTSDKNTNWPGTDITTNIEVVDCQQYYYYEYYPSAHVGWDRIIFNGGNSSMQTHNLSFNAATNAGQYQNAGKDEDGSWQDPTNPWYFAYDGDSYNTTAHPLTCTSVTSGYVELDLAANTDYAFKFVENGSTWYGCTTATKITYENKATAQTMSNTTGGCPNQTIKTAAAGTYRFTWDITNKRVTVTYPTSYQVTFDVGTLKGNSRTLIAYLNDDSNNKISSGDYVVSGTKVTFYAGGNEPAQVVQSGYGWKGFYGNASGDNPQLSSLTAYHINSISADATVYACFYEVANWITIYNEGNGDVDPDGANAYVETPTSFTANPGTGYKFDNWTQRSGALTIASPTNTTTNVNATAASVLQANFSPRWSVIGTGAFGGWTAYDAHKFDNYAVVSTKNVGYNTITLAANTSYEIKIYDRQTSTTYGGSTAQTIDYSHSGAGNQYTVATTASPKSVTIQSAAGGSYTLNWNLTDKKIAVEYPTSWYITTGQKTTGQADNAGGSFTAVDNNSNNVYGGKFVANNATVTFTATPNTGYNFVGWYSDASCETAYVNGTGGAAISGEGGVVLTLSSITGNKTIYAKFTPKNYNVALDMQSGAEGYGSGSNRNETVTYNTTLTTVGSLPTAANGYAFMGFYSAEGGKGTQFMNASGTWATSVPDTIADSKWVLDAGATLYAYYKKAEITNLALSAATVAPSTSVTATPEISPTPVAPTIICWKLLRANGNPLADQPTFTPGVGNAVSFTAPSVSGSYKVACVLRTGSVCNGGTVLDSVVTDLVVAGEHTVTIRYQDGDGRTLAASSEMTGKPLEWSDAIEPATITGYTFARWEAGDGVYITDDNGTTTKTTTTTASIKVKASYDGNLTAVYTKKRMIYFNNTLGWGSVYVYFYKNDSYWNNTNGTGAQKGDQYTSYPFSEEFYGAMTPIEGTNIWYFDCEAAGVNASYVDVVFTEIDQLGYNFFHKTDGVKNKVIRRGDYSSSLPMYVPVVEDPVEMNDHGADYYKHGYWMNYPENTGYTLKIYSAYDASKETGAVREYQFPFSSDKTMPLKLDVEFNGSTSHYWFMVYRNDGLYYGKSYTFNQNFNAEQVISSGNNKCDLLTSAPGIYTITLTYHDNGDNPKTYDYYIDVDFPVAVGDYRILYKDQVAWSGTAHNASWSHPSDIIRKNSGETVKQDTVSLFVKVDENTSAKFQYAKTIADGGAITWKDVTGGTIDLSGITSDGVYNFIVSQPAGGSSISLQKTEAYTGTYYIRTDCAGNTKWDSYTTLDHQMTYSDYAAASSDGFTHYYCHWVTSGNNIRFTIANDYSVSVSDTLTDDTYTTESLAANANIRFMYDERTNIIKRAYISGSGTITDRFLVLEGDAKMYDENGNALTGVNQDHDKYDNYLGTNNQVILHDDENFVYERTIKVNATARAKLTAKYNNKVQYFKGTEGAFADGTTIQLLGGTYSAGSKYTMRIVYDFKTNRLVTAYMPEGEISGEVEIQADMMLIREHQGEATQLTFASGSDKLTDVKSVYGVMRFNRWTLNNRQHPEDMDKEHSDSDGDITTYHPLVDAGSMKSISERGLYWVSFPFDVNLSDVFGFGTYGTHWIMMRYNGTERARIGYWKDNDEGFWEYIWDRRGVTLEKGQGYVLALELDLMKATDRTFWSNEIQQVELFFPSVSSSTGEISQANVDVTIPSHECTIDRRTDKTVDDWNKDRRIADSHWNIIGVPSYANYGSTLTDGSSTIEWHTSPKTNSLPFLYEWNANDNTYTVQSGTTYPFKAMHAYYVQYAGTLHWTLASATPSSIVARRTYAEKPESVEFKLELMQNEKMIDQTFVKLSDDEEVSANFAFGEDLNKEKNAGKANIYTLIENYMPAAGNTLPMSDQTTVVPVGVTIAAAGEYTFAIPDGTSGVGVTLVDTETNERTNLSALDYTVNLTAGTCDGRFLLEISPVSNVATGLEPTSDSSLKGREGAEKRLIDNKLFIITEDGKVFDARGAMVK